MNTEFSVKRITDALAEVDKARNEASSAKATYKAKREILAACQEALEEAIRAETSPAPLFDRPQSEVSFTAQVGQALRDGLKGTGVELIENPGQTDEPVGGKVVLGPDCRFKLEVKPGHTVEVLWNEPLGHYEAEVVSGFDQWRNHDLADPEPTESAVAMAVADALGRPVTVSGSVVSPRGRVTFGLRPLPRPAQPWTGAAAEPDAWRNQGVGLALRTLSVPTVKKLGQAGLATVGELQDWFLANPGKSIDGLGSKSTAAVEDALVKYLDSRPVPGTGEGCRDGDEDAE